MNKKVIINGAKGKLGRIACDAIQSSKTFDLIGELGRQDNLAKAIKTLQPDIVIDTTSADAVYENTKVILEAGVHAVIGTSGLTQQQIKTFSSFCAEKQLGAIIAPNFSIGANLMMRFATQAAKYFKYAEIVEMHHEKKKDAPSGTSAKTAELIASERENAVYEGEVLNAGACGANIQGVPVHSIRMPGLLAHQTVMFGGNGETLSIRHDTTDRQSFAAGVLLCCEKVTELNHLVYGMEHLLDA